MAEIEVLGSEAGNQKWLIIFFGLSICLFGGCILLCTLTFLALCFLCCFYFQEAGA